MPYEFDEIKFLNDEAADWWETVRKVPIKILDQDFGVQVAKSDLIASTAYENLKVSTEDEEPKESTADEKPKEADEQSSKGEDKPDIPESESDHVLDLDNFKRKADAFYKTGYSKVTFNEKYFVAEIFSNQFDKSDFYYKIVKGFLVIGASRKETEGDVTVYRDFERRYMLPHDCHVSNIAGQTTMDHTEGGMKVKVLKNYSDETKRSPGKPPALKPAGKSPPAKATGKSPPPSQTTGKSPPAPTKATGKSPPSSQAAGKSPPVKSPKGTEKETPPKQSVS